MTGIKSGQQKSESSRVPTEELQEERERLQKEMDMCYTLSTDAHQSLCLSLDYPAALGSANLPL